MPSPLTWTVHICSATGWWERQVNAPSWRLAREKVLRRLFLHLDLIGWLAEGADGPDSYGHVMHRPLDGGGPVRADPQLRVVVTRWRWP